jgi:4-amino-4-deoxy-L-arabinose transferase-like glycosyltransferase
VRHHLPEWMQPALSRLTARHVLLGAIVLAALFVRLWSIRAGVPHAVGIDEPAVVDRALRILRTGDWNPHIFDYPTLVIYLHAIVALARFLVGATRGEWAGLSEFDITQVYFASRVVSAAIGAATVWVTYRVGREAGSERIGLIAAAQLAILPLHVRESHFALTDVPLTALTTLTLSLTLRADRTAVWIAGAAAGFAAGAKYNGGIVLSAVLVAALQLREPLGARITRLAFAVAAAAAAFLIATPYALLDLPGFLDSFAAQMGRLSSARLPPEPGWSVYLKHFSLASSLWLPYAVAGIAAVLIRQNRARWFPILAFAAAYFYVLATHSIVFARYALPLTPVICLLAAAGVDGVARLAGSVGRFRRQTIHAAVVALVLAPLLVSFAAATIDWNRRQARRDTRQMAADWLRATLPAGSRLAVENSGPTYLASAGFDVVNVELLTAQPIEWYVQRGVQYLVVSSGVGWSEGYAAAGPRMLDVPASPERSGPAIRIVQLQQ